MAKDSPGRIAQAILKMPSGSAWRRSWPNQRNWLVWLSRQLGRAVRHLDWSLQAPLLYTQTGDLAAPAAAGGKGDHQHLPVAQIAQAVGRAGRQQFCQHVTGDLLGALAKTLSWRDSDRQPNG